MRIRSSDGSAATLVAGGEVYEASPPGSGVFEVPEALGRELIRFPAWSEDLGEHEPEVEEAAPDEEPEAPASRARTRPSRAAVTKEE